MLGWMRRKREERKARLEEARKIAAEATALDSKRKEQLLQCKKNVLDILDSGNLHPEFFVVGPEDAKFACNLILSVPSVEISADKRGRNGHGTPPLISRWL